MQPLDAALREASHNAFERRRAPVQQLADHATAVALACRDMAERFQAGGRLLVFGTGSCATDAGHIGVEFVHPVIVGKRALPALSLASDSAALTGISERHGPAEVFSRQIAAIGRPGDIALGLSDNAESLAVRRGLEAAEQVGMLTVALVGGDHAGGARAAVANHSFITGSPDAHIVKEHNVTAYHLLWELVHVFFDTPRPTAAGPETTGGVEGLYPFLYGGSHPEHEVLDSVAASTREKVDEIVAVRAEVSALLTDRLVTCALALADAVERGATVWTFGNGGSSTDAQDVAETFLNPRSGARPVPARCLTCDAAIVTALSNDVGYDIVFARQLRAFARRGDIALGLSTSGGSANVLNAFDEAKALGMLTVGLAGYGGGRMADSPNIDYLFDVGSSSVHRVQEVQTTIYHVLWELTQTALEPPPPLPGRG